MADLVGSARAVLSASERRMEATANNVANLTTPGFKSQKLYSEVISEQATLAPKTHDVGRVAMTRGKMTHTGNPLDLAIGGTGFFRLSDAAGAQFFSRQGQFKLDADGRLVDGHGLALQSADGGDIRLRSANVKVLADGTVLENDVAVATIGLVAAAPGTQPRAVTGALFEIAAPEAVDRPQIYQGMTEASNVALADEMVAMMEAMRSAEGGARLIQTYDDLMGKVVNTIGQGGR